MSMRFEELRKHYFFTRDDEEKLARIGQLILPFSDAFADAFYRYLTTFPDSAQFFRTTEAIAQRKHTIKVWLESLFGGRYDEGFLHRLEHVGRVHVARGIPIHWVSASMNFKREYLLDVLERQVADPEELKPLLRSLDKILDINLDVLNSTYHEEEIRQKFLSARMDSVLISAAERFMYGLNIVLVLALIGLSLGVVGLFATEIYSLLARLGGFEQNVLSTLGTLLIIWVMIELMRTEIKYLRGERFHVEVFVSVALVTFIRELLVASLAGESILKLALMLAAILVLGVVYFLISRTEVR